MSITCLSCRHCRRVNYVPFCRREAQPVAVDDARKGECGPEAKFFASQRPESVKPAAVAVKGKA